MLDTESSSSSISYLFCLWISVSWYQFVYEILLWFSTFSMRVNIILGRVKIWGSILKIYVCKASFQHVRNLDYHVPKFYFLFNLENDVRCCMWRIRLVSNISCTYSFRLTYLTHSSTSDTRLGLIRQFVVSICKWIRRFAIRK